MSRAEIMDWVPGSHASTFGGNPVSIAAALATMDIIEREAMGNAARVGGFILERVRGWKQSHPLVGDVRGRGLLMGLEFTASAGKDAAVISDAVTDAALELGLSANIVRAGASGGTMRIAPPLTVSDAEIDLGVELLDAAIARVMPAA